MDAIFKFCASETSSWVHRTLSLKQQPNITCIQQVKRLFREPNQTWDQLSPTFHLIVPHIFLWGSCFCSGIPSAPPPVLLRLLRHLLRTTLSHTTLSHTIFHTQLCYTPSFTYNFVTHTQLCLTLSFTQLCLTPSFTYNFVTRHLSHTALSHTTLSHTIFHTQLCRTHTTLSHTIFHIQLCHIQLCHTPFLSYTHTIFHIQLCHTPSLLRTPSLYMFIQLCHRRGTWRHPPSLCVAGVALGDILGCIWLDLVARLGAVSRWRRGTLRGRRGTLATSSGRLSNHTTCCNRMCLLCQFWFVSFLLRAPVSSRPMWCHLSPRWPGARDDAVVCAWGQRSVSHRVWQQGLWANAPCWAHTEALASQFTSLRLSNAPPCSPPQRLGGRLSHAQLWHAQLLHTQLFYTQLSHTQLVHTHTQLFHNFHTHNPCTHNCFTVLDHTVLTHTHNSSTHNCF